MTWAELRKAKEMHDEYLALGPILNELDAWEEANLLACELAEPEDVKEAFLIALQEHLDFPGPGGYIDEETGEVKEPYETERPILEYLLHEVAHSLPVEVNFEAHKRVIEKHKAAIAAKATSDATPQVDAITEQPEIVNG